MKLYVGNVPFQASEEDLSDWFTKAGFTVDNIDLVRDLYTDQSRGFGFVEIRNDEEAEHAVHVLNGSTRMKILDSRGILGLILMLTPRHSLCFNARTCPPTSQSNRLPTNCQ